MGAGSSREVLSLGDVRAKRLAGFWVVYNASSPLCIAVPYREFTVLVPVSFCRTENIRYILSYRWTGLHGAVLGPGDAPIGFLDGPLGCHHNKLFGLCDLNLGRNTTVWIDYLNHLNDVQLKKITIEGMGLLYSTRPVLAKYLKDLKPNSPQDIVTFLSCITRGWIWQELAYTGPELYGHMNPQAETIKLLVELIKTGAEIVRGILPAAYLTPGEKQLSSVLQFAIDVLWRARGGGDNASAFRFFMVDRDLNRPLLQEAIAFVEGLRHAPPAGMAEQEFAIHMRLLAALDNLENANFTNRDDVFVASFSTLLQSHVDFFGPLREDSDGFRTPPDFRARVTGMVATITRAKEWDIELWQQCAILHPLSQLDHPELTAVTLRGSTDGTLIHVTTGNGTVVDLRECYHRRLYGELEPDEGNLHIDNEPIASCSYRFRKGELIVVGFQTKTHRIVPTQGIRFQDGRWEATEEALSSRWTQTTWYSRDVDWMRVLDQWAVQ